LLKLVIYVGNTNSLLRSYFESIDDFADLDHLKEKIEKNKQKERQINQAKICTDETILNLHELVALFAQLLS